MKKTNKKKDLPIESGDKNGNVVKAAASSARSFMQWVENYLSKYYEFRFNEVTGRVEHKELNIVGPFKPISDYQINSLVRKLNRAGIFCKPAFVRNVLISDFTPVY